MSLLHPPLQNGLQKTLNADLNTGVTAAMTLNNTTGVQNKPGVVVIDRINTAGALKLTSVREWVAFTGTSGSTLTGLTRGIGGSTDQDHSTGAVVEFVMDITWAQAVIDALTGASAQNGAVTLTGATLNSPNIAVGSDAQGDMYYRASGASLSRLPKGGSGQILTMNSTLPAWSSLSSLATGSLLVYTGAQWDLVIPGTSGYLLQSQGAGLLPIWASASGSTDGWTASSDTWTYASASTFTIAGVDRTAIYTKGTRLKFTQTTAKYAVVVGSSFSTNTTVTIAVNTDYTIANASITSPSYSYQLKPQGYPGWFNYNPSFTGFSANPNYWCVYSIDGATCTFILNAALSAGTSNATTKTITLPVSTTNYFFGVLGTGQDAGSTMTAPIMAQTGGASATLNIYKAIYQTAWTGSGNCNFALSPFSFNF